MSRPKPKRVKPPKRIRYKEPRGFYLGDALLKLVEADIAAQMEADPVGYAAWLDSLPKEGNVDDRT